MGSYYLIDMNEKRNIPKEEDSIETKLKWIFKVDEQMEEYFRKYIQEIDDEGQEEIEQATIELQQRPFNMNAF